VRYDANGTMLRLRALQAMGHSSAWISRALGVREQLLTRIVRGEAKTVRADIRVSVIRLYDAIWCLRPPEFTREQRSTATRARSRAAANGWCPGLGLDDEKLDTDPNYKPTCGWRPAMGLGVAPDYPLADRRIAS
jgi:hypothetical protein